MGNYAQQYNEQVKKRRQLIRAAALGVVLLACLIVGVLVNTTDKSSGSKRPAEPSTQPTVQTVPDDGPEPTEQTKPSVVSGGDTDEAADGEDNENVAAGSMDSDKRPAPVVSLTDEQKKNLPEVIEPLRDVVIEPNYESPYYIVVYVGSQAVVIYSKNEKGQYAVEYKVITCSTGTTKNPTEPGLYAIYKKERWAMLNGSGEYENYWGQYCSAIGNGYLFHSIPYRAKAGDMMTMDMYNHLGTRASHGCIRMTVKDTKWIYENCPYGTQVYVTEKEGPTGPTPPQLNTTAKYWGYDPTDKWTKSNPYFGGKGNPPKN